MLEILYCKWCIMRAHKTDFAVFFAKVICHFLLVCFVIYVSKISDKSDKSFVKL